MYLTGMYTALITPFVGTEVDLEGLRFLIRRQIAAGVDGIVLLGTTGEAGTLKMGEREAVVKIGVEECKGKITLVVGVGTNCTASSQEFAYWAEQLGADAVLVVTPYYNRPTQKGIYAHFEAISNAISIPIIAYNVPYRTASSIDPLTLYEIAELPNVVAIKEASGNLLAVSEILHHLNDHSHPFTLLSGEDSLTLPIMAMGGHGVASALSNLVPERMVALVAACDRGDLVEARRLHYELLPLFKASNFESNPMPIKEAMTLCGLPAGPCRLPLTHISEPHREALHRLLYASGLVPAESK